MEITKDKVAKKLLSYLQNKISLTLLVDWAENAIMESDFREGEEKILRESLGKLGYKIRVDATAA